MNLTDSIKNKFSSLKESLKSSIFSKNKSIIRVSEFSKQSTFKKIISFTAVNMFVIFPYLFWFAYFGHVFSWMTMIVPTFLFGFLVSNSLFFGAGKILSSFWSLFKKKEPKQDSLIINWNDNQTQQSQPEYFPKGFIGKIKEFFTAVGSVACSFIPFLFVMNIVLFFNSLIHSVVIDVGFASFSGFFNYLKIDSVLLLLFTTLTVSSIYGFKLLSFLKRVLLKALSAQKNKENNHAENQQPSTENYKPQRSFPVEEFIPSLNKDFRKNHNIDSYQEVKPSIELKKD